MSDRLVVVRGGGDLGSGVALRLWRVGFGTVILERERPVAVRRTVSFCEAIYDGMAQVEEATGRRVEGCSEARQVLQAGEIAVLVDPGAESAELLKPDALVDAVMAKQNVGTRRGLATVVVGLGPGFAAGSDVDAVVETNRGPDLGRVIWSGGAAPNTGVPAPVDGRSASRVLRAPRAGILRHEHNIGDVVAEGETVAEVGDVAVLAPFRGLVRGLARAGLAVDSGTKIGDLDPRLDPSLCYRVSDKSLSVAGGVMEAVLSALRHTRA